MGLLSSGRPWGAVARAAELGEAEVEVLLARGRHHLRVGTYDALAVELAPYVDRDPSQRLRYLRAQACMALGDWPCVLVMLSAIEASEAAGDFPRLHLDLGLALAREGERRLARAQLELASLDPALEVEAIALQGKVRSYARRHRRRDPRVQKHVAIGLTYDSGSGPYAVPIMDPCPTLGEDLVYTCGANILERASFALRPEPLAGRLTLGLDVHHQWSPLIDDLSAFHLLGIRDRLSVGLPGAFSLSYVGARVALGNVFSPLYARQDTLSLAWSHGLGRGVKLSLGYALKGDRFADLGEIWTGFEPGSVCLTVGEAFEGPYWCTFGRSGFRQGPEAAVRVGAGSLSLSARAALETIHTQDPDFRGYRVEASGQALFRLRPNLLFRGGISGDARRYVAPSPRWWERGLRVEAEVRLPLGRRPYLGLRAAQGLRGVRDDAGGVADVPGRGTLAVEVGF